MNRIAIILPAALAVLSPPNTTAKPVATRHSLSVLYTSSASGQIRSCNCTKFRFGGYARELTLLKAIRKEDRDTVLVEGGDMVEWTGFLSGLKTEVAGRALKLLGYQAFVPGENEVGRKKGRAADKLDAKSLPMVCANLLDEPGGQVANRPYTILKAKSGLSVGLVGLLSQSVGRPFQEQEFRSLVTDPSAALRRILPALRARCDLVVVIYHGPVAEAEKTAALRGVDVVLATHRSERRVLMPEKGLNEVEAPVRTVNGVTIVATETHENWSLGRIDLETSGTHKITSAKHKLIYLDRSFPEDAAMVAIYEEYNTRVKAAVLNESNQFKSKAESLLVGRGFSLVEMRKRLRASQFATAEKCKSCHAEIHQIWSNSRHAQAMETLKKTHQEFDPDCVSCHTTGLMAGGGYTNLRDTPELANVQCEACHGPGLKHSQKPDKNYGYVAEQMCRSCHTDDRTPDFDFEQSWAHIMH